MFSLINTAVPRLCHRESLSKQQRWDAYQSLTTLPKASRAAKDGLRMYKIAYVPLQSWCVWKDPQSTESVLEKSLFLFPFSWWIFVCQPHVQLHIWKEEVRGEWETSMCICAWKWGHFCYTWNSSLKLAHCGVRDIRGIFQQRRVNRFIAHCCLAFSRACRAWSWQPLQLFRVAWHKQSNLRFVSG